MSSIYRSMLVVSFLVCCCAGENAVGQEKKDGVVVIIDGLSSKAPAEWKHEKPDNELRYKQFRLTKLKDDKEDAEVVIFKLGGSVQANIKRWKEMFIPPEGKKIDDVAKVTEMKIGGLDAHYLDVHGTYKAKDRPFDPKSKEVRKASYRMIAVQIEGKMDPYQIRFVGPAGTVEHYKQGFDEWLKGFK
jgi:hypothetical protein